MSNEIYSRAQFAGVQSAVGLADTQSRMAGKLVKGVAKGLKKGKGKKPYHAAFQGGTSDYIGRFKSKKAALKSVNKKVKAHRKATRERDNVTNVWKEDPPPWIRDKV